MGPRCSSLLFFAFPLNQLLFLLSLLAGDVGLEFGLELLLGTIKVGVCGRLPPPAMSEPAVPGREPSLEDGLELL